MWRWAGKCYQVYNGKYNMPRSLKFELAGHDQPQATVCERRCASIAVGKRALPGPAVGNDLSLYILN